MNMNRIRVKNVAKARGFIYAIGFVIQTYIINGTKENNIFNAFI